MEARFAVVTSNRLDRLVDHLAESLRRQPLPPLQHEIVVVQSQGMQRWLTLELARHHGVAACLTTPFPRPFCRHLLRQLDPRCRVPGSEPIPRQDASDFGREMLLWRLVESLYRLRSGDRSEESDSAEDSAQSFAADSSQDSAESVTDKSSVLAAPLAYLEDDGDQRKLYQLASRLAGLFDDYQLYRGDLLQSWLESRSGSYEGGPEIWQAELWRELSQPAVNSPPPAAGTLTDEPLDQSLRRLIDRLQRGGGAPEGLPTRLAVLGVASLPPVFIELLVALGRFIPVTVYLVSPTYHYWGDLRSERETARIVRRLPHRDLILHDDQHWQSGHPLLASLGKQGRELFDLLQQADIYGNAWHELDFEQPEGASALAVLQRDVLHLIDRTDPSSGEEKALLDAADESLTLHLCHSQMREMQVIRHQLLRAFDQMPDLRPSDVLILVPDMERYGPYIQAVFGAAKEDGVPFLPFSIADRGAGREQPPSEIVVRLLELAEARLTLRQVFDLLETPAVRRAFGLGEDDLPTLRQLCLDAGVRWALSAKHKERLFDLPLDPSNTWRAGLDRLLMGYAVGRLDDDDRWPSGASESLNEQLAMGISPAAGDTAGIADILGRFTELIDRLERSLTDLRRRRPLGEWAKTLGLLVDDFFTAESEEEDRGLQLVRDVAHQVSQAAERIDSRAELSLQVVREHLASALKVDGFGSGFLNGQITFCALRPMRTIPFRVIGLCGLDAGVFPRRDRRPGFDLMARLPRAGDRSVRDDDRYLFLETLLAARDRLLITHVGRSQQDGSERQPSAVVSELLEQIDRSFQSPDDELPSSHLTVVHPLQPWSTAYFDGRDERLVNYGAEQVRTAEQLREPRQVEPPLHAPTSSQSFEPQGLEAQEGEAREAEAREVNVLDLIRFWKSPSQWFCKQALGISLGSHGGNEAETEPMLLHGLDGYAVRQWMAGRRLKDRAAGRPSDPEAEWRLLRLRGELPPGALGGASLQTVERRVDAFLKHVPKHRPLAPHFLDLGVDMPGDLGPWRLVGVLDSLTEGGLLRFRCAKLRPVDWLHAWIEHLVHGLQVQSTNALQAAVTENQPAGAQAWLIGEDATIRFLPVTDPGRYLADLLLGLENGEKRPLPCFPATSHRYAEHAKELEDPRRKIGRSPEEVARAVFNGDERPPGGVAPPGEAEDPWVRLAFRGRDPLSDLEFPTLAESLWRPIFQHSKQEER